VLIATTVGYTFSTTSAKLGKVTVGELTDGGVHPGLIGDVSCGSGVTVGGFKSISGMEIIQPGSNNNINIIEKVIGIILVKFIFPPDIMLNFIY